MRQTSLYSNKQLALQPVLPAHDVHIEGEKTEQKAIQRRTVDALGPYTRWLEERACHWDEYRFRAMIPTAAAAAELVPPIGYLSQPATSYTNKYTHTSMNKIRCSIDSVTWTPDGKRCLTGSHRGEFTLWNGVSFKFEGILQAHEAATTCMLYTHNENWLVTTDAIGRVKYWKGRNELVKEFEAHRESVRCLSFAPSDIKFATASTDSTLKIWDFRTCQEDRTLSGHARDVLSCDWHPSSSVLVSSSRDYTIRLWDARVGGEALSSLEGHMNEVTTVQWHQNGHFILSAGRDNQLKIWDTRTMKELSNFTGSQAPINCAAWHPIHEDVFVSGSHDGNVLFWLATRPGAQAEISGAHEGPVWCLAWNPLGHMLATGGGDHCARFWCRARPGDAWRDKTRSDQEGAGQTTGLPAARHAGEYAMMAGGIPGIGDALPSLPGGPLGPVHPIGQGGYGGVARPVSGASGPPSTRPPYPGPWPQGGRPPSAPHGVSSGQRRSHDTAFRGGSSRGGSARPRLMRPESLPSPPPPPPTAVP